MKGFTLIELLIVIVLLAVLSGVLMRVLDVVGLQDETRDGVRVSNMNKLVAGIQAYRVVNRTYPTSVGGEAMAPNYIESWPSGHPVPADVYTYDVVADGSSFVVWIPSSVGGCYKYHTSFAEVQFCSADGDCVFDDSCTP